MDSRFPIFSDYLEFLALFPRHSINYPTPKIYSGFPRIGCSGASLEMEENRDLGIHFGGFFLSSVLVPCEFLRPRMSFSALCCSEAFGHNKIDSILI